MVEIDSRIFVPSPIYFSELKEDTYFIWGGQLYVKCHQVMLTNGSKPNAFCLNDNQLYYFSGTEGITPKDIKITEV